MLQQTQVATVLPYYERFLAAFPDVRALAAAPLDRVLEYWSGLGYYRRAHHLPAAAQASLEGKGKRVLARHRGIAGWPGTPKVEAKLWRTAEALLPQTNIETYTQALMDLGATVCTRSSPRCDVCPVARDCVARLEGRIGKLPSPRP